MVKVEEKIMIMRARNAIRKDDTFNIVMLRKDLILASLDSPFDMFINELLSLVNNYCANLLNPSICLWQLYQIECAYKIK